MAVKDIIDVAGMPTRCGAEFLPAEPAVRNAAVVDALLGCGAFVAAKSVTTVFAYLDPGPTCNPWNPAHTPGGSSSGSAAAVACGMVRLALGDPDGGVGQQARVLLRRGGVQAHTRTRAHRWRVPAGADG